MSLNSLVNSATARRPDFPPIGGVPGSKAEIAAAAHTPPLPDNVAKAGTRMAVTPGRVDTAFNVLFGYIPTEVLTLYVAVIAAFPKASDANRLMLFYIFLAGTPIAFWLVYAAKLKSAKKQLPLPLSSWPVWEMFAATVAFAAWAFALPDSPLASSNSSGLSSLMVLGVSTVLGLLAPIFQRDLDTA